MKIKLPFWMDKENGQLQAIVKLFERWWGISLNLIKMPLSILDEENCSERVLNLIAYSRDIERFDDEPLNLFRKRVKYAFINAKEAGSKIGFIRIFERLGIGYVEIEERFDPINWDVIKLRLTDSQYAKNQKLINLLIRKYGRTCRRYTLEIIVNQEVILNFGEFHHEYKNISFSLNNITQTVREIGNECSGEYQSFYLKAK